MKRRGAHQKRPSGPGSCLTRRRLLGLRLLLFSPLILLPCSDMVRLFPFATVVRSSSVWVRALSTTTTATVPRAATGDAPRRQGGTPVAIVPESEWRARAFDHAERVRELLGPGLTGPNHPANSGQRRRDRRKTGNGAANGGGARGGVDYVGSSSPSSPSFEWTGLDKKNPVYNFLIEYYGLKGKKGPRRLARWSPDPSLVRDVDVVFAPPDSPAGRIAGRAGGVLLENASEDDLGDLLHLRGAVPVSGEGILYSPALFQSRYDDHSLTGEDDRRSKAVAAAPFQWHASILQSTLKSEPVLHCYGLHEWAMQYQPDGAPPPPSGKYQSHLDLRVEQSTINRAVERRGIHCTHVDALRFFAPAAAPLNHAGSKLERTDQLRLEQSGCVHAHMDLLKIAMRLQPFVDASLVTDALEIALDARRLDVAASPYDATAYGIAVVPIERAGGRKEYRIQQAGLMRKAASVRARLLNAYEYFLGDAFDPDVLMTAEENPAAERMATAEPGGKPWRRSLIGKEGGEKSTLVNAKEERRGGFN